MTSSTCSACGAANRAGARFCDHCGEALALTCGACGAELRPGARFCDSCGRRVAAEETEALKVVSVVFCDLVGSTAMQEAVAAESIRRMMARFYEMMRAVVEHHGGQVQKFIGDAVVAVFGVPVVGEDDALRAVRCAAEMVARLEELDDELERIWGVRLQMRTGVNTGELVISEEGILVGDTMNTAARLEQAASAGEVLLGEATWRLVRGQVQLEEAEPLALRGKSEPVRAWRLLSPDSSRVGADAPLEAPLVGRSAELARLHHALQQAIAARACRLVTVIGSPGLGKSRLASEFASSLAESVTVLAGQCEASGEGITFLPIADVLRMAAGVADDDSGEEVVAKLSRIVSEVPGPGRVVALAAGLLGAGPTAAPEETFWGVRTVLESLARKRPVVIVLDDVHWGQPMFLDLIEHLVEWVRDSPVLLVALARPELREQREALSSAGRRALDVIELEPLEEREGRELVDGLLGGVELPDELLERILDTTEGNPLFLSELLRMLVDEGALVRRGEGWVAVSGAEAVQVPPTISALLTARIERLREEERSVVERAAVIGQQFYRGAVAELVAPPVRFEIDGHLETLRRKDLVEPEGTYWIDEPVYRFHHVLIRDAAYQLLLKEARAELHERFADWLAGKAGELVGEYEEVIAYHLEQAHKYRRQLGPLDAHGEALGARAAQLFASAGRRALAREDLAAATNLLRRSLERGADENERVLWDLAEALLSAGNTAAVHDVVQRLSGPRKVVLESQLSILTGGGRVEDLLAEVLAATKELASAGDDVAAAKGFHVAAQAQAQLGRIADVELSLDLALLAARKAGDRRRITAVLAAAPRAALWGPSPVVRASGRCLDVVRILRMTPGNRHVEAVALRCQAVLEAMRRRFDAAREILASGRATLEELGLALELHELAMYGGIVELLAGEPAAAEELLRGARDGFAALGVSVSAAQAAALLARALAEQGRDEDALGQTEYSEQHSTGDLKSTVMWLGVRADVLARAGQIDRAHELAEHAATLAEPTDALADKADAALTLARVLVAAGRTGEARGVASKAQALYTAKDHIVGVDRAGKLAGAVESPRATGPASAPAQLGSRTSERFLAEIQRLQHARDYERIGALVADDWYHIDHRPLGWPEGHGRQGCMEIMRSVYDSSPHMRAQYDEVLAADEDVIAVRQAWRGRGVKAGGYEVTAGAVYLFRDGRWAGFEFFDADDRQGMIARYAELGGGQGKLGDRPPERVSREFVRAFAARDLDRLAELTKYNHVLVDRRGLSWEEVAGRNAWQSLMRSTFHGVSDIRVEIDEVLACDERVIAAVLAWRGTSSAKAGGGRFELPVGHVTVIEDGTFGRVEQFEPTDREAMLRRYRELGGEIASDSERRLSERVIAEMYQCLNARNYERLAELVVEDGYVLDHRALGWEEAHGRDMVLTIMHSWLDASPALRVEHEVLASDDGVVVMRMTIRGHGVTAGELEIEVGAVHLVVDGRWMGIDFYDPDDRQAMIARYAELGGGLGALGETAAERVYAEFCRRYARRDLGSALELVSEDLVRTDQRQVGWARAEGRDEDEALIVSAWAGTSDLRAEIDEVLAADERTLALRTRWVGHDRRGGAFELPLGQVVVVANGQLVSIDQYDPEDRDAMLARFEELARGHETVLDQRPPERFYAEYARRWATGDEEALLELVDPEWTQTDRRSLAIWEEQRGYAGARAEARSAFRGVSEPRFTVQEVLACDDNVMAARFAWSGIGYGGASFTNEMGAVSVVRDGRQLSLEVYDPDDRQAMIARYAELGGGLGKLGESVPECIFAEWCRRYAARDLDQLLELVADDIRWVDHRKLGWEPTVGRDGVEALLRSAWGRGRPVDRIEVDEVLATDERVLAVRFRWVGYDARGGHFELMAGQVNVYEDGRCVTVDQYDADDRDAMLARYTELTHEARVPERLVRQIAERYNAGDIDGVLELYADDIELVDHRRLSGEPVRGRTSARGFLRSMFEVSPDNRFAIDEVIACDDRVIAFRQTHTGTSPAAGGGSLEMPIGLVCVCEGGRLVSLETYDPDDRQAMVARYGELGGDLSALPSDPAGTLVHPGD